MLLGILKITHCVMHTYIYKFCAEATPTTYIMLLTIGHPIHIVNWAFIYIYTLQRHYGYKLSMNNIYYMKGLYNLMCKHFFNWKPMVWNTIFTSE